jgi:hypothetical protein
MSALTKVEPHWKLSANLGSSSIPFRITYLDEQETL